MADRTCRVENCSRLVLARGMCSRHYDRARYRERAGQHAAKYRAKNPLGARTCPECGESFTPQHGSQRFCRASCRQRKHYDLRCFVCDSKMCRQALSLPDGEARCLACRSLDKATRSPERKACSGCGVDITGQNRRALCVSCSKAAERERKRKRTVTWTCPKCGDPFTFPETSKKTRSPFCSRVCRLGPPKPKPPPPVHPVRSCVHCSALFQGMGRFCNPLCGQLHLQGAIPGTLERLHECKRCGIKWVGPFDNKVQCDDCRRFQRREGKNRRRARLRAARVEVVNVADVFRRDGWVCQLCGIDVDRAAKGPDVWSAALDHIIPLNCGGEHSMANTQCSHFICNSIKSDRMLYGPLPLLGQVDDRLCAT